MRFLSIVLICLAEETLGGAQCKEGDVLDEKPHKVTARQCANEVTLIEEGNASESPECVMRFHHLVLPPENRVDSVKKALHVTNALTERAGSQVCNPKLETEEIVNAVFPQPQGVEDKKLRCWFGPVVFGEYSQSTSIESKAIVPKIKKAVVKTVKKAASKFIGFLGFGKNEETVIADNEPPAPVVSEIPLTKAQTVCAAVVSHRVNLDLEYSLWDSPCDGVVLTYPGHSNMLFKREMKVCSAQGSVRFNIEHGVKVGFAMKDVHLKFFHPSLHTFLSELNIITQQPSGSVYDGIVVRSWDTSSKGKAFVCYGEEMGWFATFEFASDFRHINDSSKHLEICTSLLGARRRLRTVLDRATSVASRDMTANFQACTDKDQMDGGIFFEDCFGAPGIMFEKSISVSKDNCKVTLVGPFTSQPDLKESMKEAIVAANTVTRRNKFDVCNPSSKDETLKDAVQPVAGSNADKSLVCKIMGVTFGSYEQRDTIKHFGLKANWFGSKPTVPTSIIPMAKAKKICAGVLERREKIEHPLNMFDSPCTWNGEVMHERFPEFARAFNGNIVCPDQKSVRFQVQNSYWVTLNGIQDPHRLFATPLLKEIENPFETSHKNAEKVWQRSTGDGTYFCYRVEEDQAQPFLFGSFKQFDQSKPKADDCAHLLHVRDALDALPRWTTVDRCGPMTPPAVHEWIEGDARQMIVHEGVHYSDCRSGSVEIARLNDKGVLECSVHISGVTFASGEEAMLNRGLLSSDLCNPQHADNDSSPVEVSVSYHPDRQVVYCGHDAETESLSWVTYWVKDSITTLKGWQTRGKDICERIARLKKKL